VLPESPEAPPAGAEQPASGVSDTPPNPAILYDFIQPRLALGTTYTALATQVGRQLGHQYTALLEQIAALVEGYRTESQPLLSQYPAFILALNRLPLTDQRAFTPAWKTLILSSNLSAGGQQGGRAGGGAGGHQGATQAADQATPDLSDDFNPTFEPA
jgi:hypothetical protein